MLNKLLLILLLMVPRIAVAQDQTPVDTSASIDSLLAVPHSGPLGINDETGLVLFSVALLVLVLSMFLWRRNIMARMQ
jgi:hypothetical protein